MISDARIVNPLMGDKFRLEFSGYNPVYFTKLKLPGWEFEVVEHSGGGQTLAVKYLGKEKVNEFTFEAIIDATGEDRDFWEERRRLQRTRDPKKYWIDGTAILLGTDETPAMQWHLQSACFSKVEIDEFDSEDGKKKASVKGTGVCYDCVQEPL